MHEVPLTPAQMHLWLLDRRLGAEMALIARAEPLRGEVDGPALERSLRRVAARHAALRTSIEVHRGHPVQRVTEDVTSRLLALPSDGVADPALAVLMEEQRAALTPLDLSAAPPIRLGLVSGPGVSLLVATAHPVIADERSLAIVLRELAACHRAELDGTEPRLGPSVSYAEHVASVERALGVRGMAALDRYWRRRGARPGPASDPPARSTLTEAVALQLASPVLERLEAIAGEQDAALVGILAACLAAVRCRWGDASTMPAGLVVDTRRAESTAVVGPCTALAPLDVAVAPASPGRRYATAVVREAVDRVAHAALPIDDLLVPRTRGDPVARRPVPQAWIEEDVSGCTHLARLAGLDSEARPIRRGRSIPDLRLLAHRRADGLALALEYHLAAMSREAAVQLLEGVAAFAAALAESPARPAGVLPVLSARHRALLVERAAGPTRRAGEQDAVEVLQRAAERDRDAVAVLGEDGARLTYGELMEQADELAARLRGLGVERDSVVAVTSRRSPGLVVAIVAILRAGGAVLALEPGHASERVGHMLRDSGARLLLTDRAGERAAGLDDGITVLDLDLGGVTRRATHPPHLDPRQLAYVVYTSGSMGRPKGVLVEHRSLANQLTWLRDELRLGPGDRVPFKYPLGFDACFSELLGTLGCGATVVVARSGGERDAGYLLDLCAAHDVTAIDVTPSHLEALLRHPAFARLRTLRMVLCGGEELPPATAERCLATTGAALYNLYGPAEATITAAFHRVEVVATDTIPIGRAVANTTVHVLDRDLEPVPVGVVGEICVGGVQVARGYTPGAGASEARFVPDPFAGASGARLLRTGDLGRVRPDGGLEFAGRVDRQVQVRGHRVEPSEIEAVLGRHPAVRRCAVVPARDSGIELHAFVVPLEPLHDAAGLRAFLRERLPDAMVPSRFHAVEELPLLPSGKLERRALARQRTVELPPGPPSRPAMTESEAKILQAFAGVLRRAGVGVDDSFFDLGGDSLQAVELVLELEDVLGRAVEIRDVFEAPSPAALADRLEDAVDLVADLRLPPLPGVRPAHRLRASAAQHAVLDGGLEPGDPAHNLMLAVGLPARVDEGALRAAVRLVVERHGALRTELHQGPAGWRQVVRDSVPAEPELLSVGSEEAVGPALRTLASRPFDLATPPLARFALVRTATRDALMVAGHRAVADRWSLEILLRDFSRFLFHLTEGCALPPALATGYAEYSRWLDDLVGSGALDGPRRHWLPFESPNGPGPGARPAAAGPAVTIEGPLDPAVTLGLRSLAGRSRLGLGAILRAGLCAALLQEDELPDGVLGLPDGGRRGLRALDGVVGPFERLLPIRPRWTAGGRLEELVGEMRRSVSAARANALGAASVGGLVRPQVSFAQRAKPALRADTVELTPIGAAEPAQGVHLEVEATEADDTITVALRERPGAWRGRPGPSIDAAYRAVLRQMARGDPVLR